jgi:protein involved in polysaccharide export with SLBB domain
VVPPAAARTAIPEHAANGRDHGPLVMYAGNLDPYQDLECLLEGFGRLRSIEPRARLVIVTHRAAHPSTAARAGALAGAAGVSVREVNSFAAAQRELAKADVLVCPRRSWSGFPIKVLNYMTLGRPIVHARESAHAIEDGVTGVLFDAGDPSALARAVVRLVRDPALAQALGRHARATARERYGWGRVLAGLQQVYERVDRHRDGRGRRPPREQEMEYGMNTETHGVEGRKPVRTPGAHRPQRRMRLAPALLVGLLFGCAAQTTDAPLPPVGEPLSANLAESGQYRLEPGDVLRVKFIYQPEMDVKVEIDPDGNIAIPGVGELQAKGKTAEELATDIETLSSQNLRDPEVTVIVAQLGPRKIYVGGEVRLPGPVNYRVGMTPMQAILDRGGFTEVARIDSVLHVTSKGNSVEATRLNFNDEINKGSPELNILAVNDVIYVPRTFIGDANAFVRLYIRGLMPTMPRLGVGLNP